MGPVTLNAHVARNEFSVECNGATHNADNRDDLSLLDITASLYLDNKWWMRLSLLLNSYDRASAPPDDVGRQKGCKVWIVRKPEVSLVRGAWGDD
jgi:hypothetical protein